MTPEEQAAADAAAAGTAGTGAASTDTAAADAAAAAAAAGTQTQSTNSQAEKVEDLPAWAQKVIADTRKEAGDHRTAAKNAAETAQREYADKLAVALGIKPDAATDPAALAASLSASQAKQRAADIQLAVYRAASQHQGNPDALLDSNSFLAKVSDLDPTSGDFATQVSDAIKSAVAANPNLKTARTAGASGIETGGTGEQGQISEAQLAQMTPEQIVEAQAKGLLKNLLG
jgi:hypothetical protein